MKQLSIGLNIILIVAVAFLYYHIYGKPAKVITPANSGGPAANVANYKHAPIAYVELDSLNEKIFYIKEKRKELEAEQKNIETDWQNSYHNLENQKNQFLKKGAAITQEEAEKFQGQLIQQQQQADGKKQTLTQKLNEKSYRFMEDIQKNLKDFLNDYNKDHDYMYILTTGTGLDYMVYRDSSLNITNDVVMGMNKKMKRKVSH